MDKVTTFTAVHTNTIPLLDNLIEGELIGIWHFYHKCDSRVTIHSSFNPKGNRCYCEKCGMVKKAEVISRKEG